MNTRPTTYAIRIDGHLDDRWSARLGELDTTARVGIRAVRAAALPAEAGVSPSSAGALLPLLKTGTAGHCCRNAGAMRKRAPAR